MAGRQDEATKSPSRPDQARGGRRGKDTASADEHAAKAVGCRHLEHGLDDFAVEIASIPPQNQRLAFESVQAVKHRLHEVFRIVGLRKDAHFLAQARSARLLVSEGGCGNGLDHAGIPCIIEYVLLARPTASCNGVCSAFLCKPDDVARSLAIIPGADNHFLDVEASGAQASRERVVGPGRPDGEDAPGPKRRAGRL